MTRYAIWQSRPLFVTSTFRDMHAERDHLRDVVFPALEERLRERFHHLEPIDLRLGVQTAPAEDAAARELLILKVCLDEIERSRPFLIGLLGDRYGWVPPSERMEATAREAGYARDLTGHSVTALEIEYGVLGSREQRGRSRFYLREPLPYDGMDAAMAAEFSEAHARDPEAPERRRRLGELKALLARELPPERVRSYLAEWDAAQRRVVGLEAWGRRVIEDLWEDLEAETRAALTAPPATWQEREARLLEQFVATSCVEFVGREEVMAGLTELAAGAAAADGALGACVVGPAGSGKSSLFAELHCRLRTLRGSARARRTSTRSCGAGASNWRGRPASPTRPRGSAAATSCETPSPRCWRVPHRGAAWAAC